MERLKFCSEEHVQSAITDALERRGVDVLTAQAAGRRGLADDEQLAYAYEHRRVMVTGDSDYIALAVQGQPHAGIAFIKSRTSVSEAIRWLQLMYDALTPDDMLQHVEYL